MELLKKVFNSEIRAINETEQTITAYISTNSVDRMGEVLDPAGVDLTNYKKNPVVLWAHDYSQLPIGKALWTKRDGEGVISKVKFASHAFAQDVFQLYKEGIMKAFSVGFIPKDWVEGKSAKDPTRTYTKWEMLEYSAVPVPANPDAVSLAISKGLLKNEELKALLVVKEDSAPLQEFNLEEPKDIIEETCKEIELDNQLDDLIAENKLSNEKITALEKENAELKYKVFTLLTEKQKALSEITADSVVKRIEDVTRGVIRKAQGKLD